MPEPTSEESWFWFCKKRIDNAIVCRNIDSAIHIVYEWADLICEKLHIKKENNWKFFKRAIIRKYFGENYLKKKFYKNWDYHDVLNFIQKYPDFNFRISIFPNDIACHSQSIPLPKNLYTSWGNILSSIDNSCEVEVFQQASDDSSICFRRFSTIFGESIKYEAGFGQAMYIFEAEQGKHPVLSATNNGSGYNFLSSNNCPEELYEKLSNLISSYDYYLHAKCKSICCKLGIEWVSIEGYYSKENPVDLIIVDIDLPFDYVFMQK
jgi:hypothetical protein